MRTVRDSTLFFFFLRYTMHASLLAGRPLIKGQEEDIVRHKIYNEMKVLKLIIYAAVASLFLAVMAPAALAEEQRIHFFGNSYTSFSGGLETFVKRLLEESLNYNTTVYAKRTTRNGARLSTHLGYAREKLLESGNPRWDLVVLQDQSVIPAYLYSNIWYESLNAGVELNKIIEETGAVTMFMQTWGRQRGLKRDAFFTNYTIMQDYLTRGYREYQLAAINPRSFVAPVGLAYQLVWDSQGSDTGNRFRELYGGDESHPTRQGTFLAACVIYAAYTGRSVSELEWCAGINQVRCDFLKRAADEAVFDDDTFYPSRWDLPGFSFPAEETDAELTAVPTPPIVRLTTSPSAAPSADPSVMPSVTPSVAPSVSPSVSPSARPSVSPSAVPTDQPSQSPTKSSQPSVFCVLAGNECTHNDTCCGEGANVCVGVCTRAISRIADTGKTQYKLSDSERVRGSGSIRRKLLKGSGTKSIRR
jgi:hypothetical protein